MNIEKLQETREKILALGREVDEHYASEYQHHDDTQIILDRLLNFHNEVTPGDLIQLVRYYEKRITKLEATAYHRHLFEQAIREIQNG